MSSKKLDELVDHDRSLGLPLVAGTDEAGRGCLAGPLVTAAVLLDLESLTQSALVKLTDLKDSKKLSPAARERLYPEIFKVAQAVVVVSRTAAEIDDVGLHKTNLSALREALEQVALPGSILLSDSFDLGSFGEFPYRAITKGDNTSAAIAAASVVAKVERDRFMGEADLKYPGWGFADHMGYATKAHRAAIERLGPSPIHRMSFKSAAYAQLKLI